MPGTGIVGEMCSDPCELIVLLFFFRKEKKRSEHGVFGVLILCLSVCVCVCVCVFVGVCTLFPLEELHFAAGVCVERSATQMDSKTLRALSHSMTVLFFFLNDCF
jgi:hypothetical protein